MTFKKFTVKELIDAIRENGIPWTQNNWFTDTDLKEISTYSLEEAKRENRKIGSACVLGVACINLGIAAEVDISVPIPVDDDVYDDTKSLTDEIIEYNDGQASSWEDAATFALSVLEPYKDITFEAEIFDYTGLVDKVPRIKIIDGQESLWGPEVV